MTAARIGRPKVLVVDDEEELADMYATMLSAEYDVRTVYGAVAALEAVDETFDVVLLDRKMPEIDGAAVLSELRRRNLDVRIAMVTAVEPDLDIIDMPFDDYLCKPVDRDELLETVERLLLVDSYERARLELSSAQVKRNVLAAELRDDELSNSAEFAALEERIAELRAAMERIEAELDEEYLVQPQAA